MSYIEWNKKYELGIEIIDYQHKKLVSLINDLHDTNEKKEFKEDLLGVILDELAQYTVYHFSTEEQMMQKVNYVNYDSHHKLHANFVKKLEDFKERFSNKKENISESLFVFLKQWLIDHIEREDKEISYHITTGGGLV